MQHIKITETNTLYIARDSVLGKLVAKEFLQQTCEMINETFNGHVTCSFVFQGRANCCKNMATPIHKNTTKVSFSVKN